MSARSCIALLSALLLCACGYDDFGPYEPGRKPPPADNADIGDIAAVYNGTPVTVQDDLVLSGRVTADDRSGNFYRVFMMEDATGAIEVRAGSYDLHNVFPVGRRVFIHLRGLVIGAYNGVLQVGLPPIAGSGFQTDYFGVPAVVQRYVVVGDERDLPQPAAVFIADLDEGMCGRLVRIENVTSVADGSTTLAVPFTGPGSKPQTGYRIFADAWGNEIAVVTSGYADFAGAPLPAGAVSLTGILSKGKTDTGREMYMIRMRDGQDVQDM